MFDEELLWFLPIFDRFTLILQLREEEPHMILEPGFHSHLSPIADTFILREKFSGSKINIHFIKIQQKAAESKTSLKVGNSCFKNNKNCLILGLIKLWGRLIPRPTTGPDKTECREKLKLLGLPL